MGSDSGGSIRMPAGLCGVVGLKPTFGLLDTGGLMQISSSMDHHGPMTRTVEDSALVLQALTENTLEGPRTSGGGLSISLKKVKRNIRGIRIGVPKEFFAVPVDPEVRQAIKRALKVFHGLGVVLKEVSWPLFPYASAISSAILAVDAADSLRPLILKNASQIDPLVRNRIASGFFIPAVRYLQAQKARKKLNQQGYELFRQIDLLAGPTLGVAAPKIGAKEVTISGAKIGIFKAFPSFVRAFNLNGCPAISVPCGFTKQKLPIGLQIAGAPFAEETVLQAAYAYEKANPLYEQHPPI
jgi:aspartyl-tRNA(Asn)/glutamyl-tRNA(Gln) amidotransferase subunit A